MSIAPVRGRRQSTDFRRFFLNHQEFILELAALRAEKARQLNNLRALDQSSRHHRVRQLLRRRDLHVLYAYQAVRRSGRLRRSTPDSIRQLASTFNAFAPVEDEPFALRSIDKGSGRRTVHDFGPRRRMQQAFVADILRALNPLPRTQSMFNGGIPAALGAVARGYSEGGCTHGTEVDFVGFYASVQSPEALVSLLRPLPASVVWNVVWDEAMRRPGVPVLSDVIHPTSSSPQGLSLGAATSPLVGEVIMSRVLAVAQLADTITYADNLFFLGRSDAEIIARIERLREALACQPFGSLELRVERTERLDLVNAFEFVKHAGHVTETGIRWGPGARKLEQYMVSEAQHVSLAQLDAAERRVSQWRRSYPSWDAGDALEAEYLAGLAVRRFYLNSSPEHLSRAARAVILAYIARCRIEPNFAGGVLHFMMEEGDPQRNGHGRLLEELEGWLLALEQQPTMEAA